MVSVTLEGGLGNILFQLAATLSYAKKYRMDYVIPTTTGNPRWKHYKFKKLVYGAVDLRPFYHHRHHDIFYEQRPYSIRYKEIPYYENILLRGHFLSHKYFEQFHESIISLFDFKWRYEPSTISVHQRCGDYRKMQEYLPIMPIGYYQKAVEAAVEKTGIKKILVFGDEPDYNKQWFTQERFPMVEKIEFADGKNEVEDLERISGCPVNICGNSTYALWGHYLNQHRYKMIIAPKKYYGPAYGEVDTCDLWPENAILV